MVASVNNTNEQRYKKPCILTCAGGTALGLFAMGIPQAITNETIQPKIIKIADELGAINADEFLQIEAGIKKSLDKESLASKGISIIKYSPEKEEKITKLLEKENPILSKIKSKFLKSAIGLVSIDNLREGTNAVYLERGKKILMPEKNLLMAVFHEEGHAGVCLSKLGKIVSKSKYLSVLALPTFLIALIKTKKAPGEKPKNKVDKVTDFVKNNAGKLTFLFSGVPLLLDEGFASIKSVNYAKKVLSPDLVKKLSKNYRFYLLTYLVPAIATSLGVALGVKIRNAIAKPKPITTDKNKQK